MIPRVAGWTYWRDEVEDKTSERNDITSTA